MDGDTTATATWIATVVFLGGGFFAVTKYAIAEIRKTILEIKVEFREDITTIHSKLENVNLIVRDNAVRDERLLTQARRIERIEERFERLRRGDGWDIEREYGSRDTKIHSSKG